MSSHIGRRRRQAALLVIISALVGIGLALEFTGRDRGALDQPGIGGPFALRDGAGHTITDRDLRGHWLLVYFGYTHCPDACPTALSDIAAALDLLGKERKRIVPVFITVDPDRDTPAVMRDYVAAFDAPIVALSGSPAAIATAEQAYNVYAAKRPGKDGDYEMDHPSIIYVMDPQGRFVTNFTHQTDPKTMAAKLRALGA